MEREQVCEGDVVMNDVGSLSVLGSGRGDVVMGMGMESRVVVLVWSHGHVLSSRKGAGDCQSVTLTTVGQ